MKRTYPKRSYPLDEIRRFLEPGLIVLVSSAWRALFAVSARLMRRTLVELARRHNLKRGRGVQHVPLDEPAVVSDPPVDLVALDDALTARTRRRPKSRGRRDALFRRPHG